MMTDILRNLVDIASAVVCMGCAAWLAHDLLASMVRHRGKEMHVVAGDRRQDPR